MQFTINMTVASLAAILTTLLTSCPVLAAATPLQSDGPCPVLAQCQDLCRYMLSPRDCEERCINKYCNQSDAIAAIQAAQPTRRRRTIFPALAAAAPQPFQSSGPCRARCQAICRGVPEPQHRTCEEGCISRNHCNEPDAIQQAQPTRRRTTEPCTVGTECYSAHAEDDRR